MRANDRKLCTKEIAAEMQCSVETVRRWWREGKLKPYGAFKPARTSTIRMPLSGLRRFKRAGR